MKKQLKMLVILALAVWVGAGAVYGQTFRPLSIEEMVVLGATHVVTITTAELTTTTADTAQALDLVVPAGSAVEFIGMKLLDPFVTATTAGNQYTTSLTLAVGDSASATRYLGAQQLARRNVEVYWAWPHATAVARYLYNTAGTLRFTFTPAGGVGVAAFTGGKVELHFKIVPYAVPRVPTVTGD